MANIMKEIIEIIIEIDRDSFSHSLLIWGCQMLSNFSRWPGDKVLHMPLFLHNLVPINSISEINLFWAAHQVHHSSEDYNLTTALRQSIMQYFSSWVKNNLFK